MVVVFLSKLAEKEKGTSIPEILDAINEKLIRRHPHVYGDAEVDSLGLRWTFVTFFKLFPGIPVSQVIARKHAHFERIQTI